MSIPDFYIKIYMFSYNKPSINQRRFIFLKVIKKFFINGMVLTLTSVFMRFVSVVFNVYITNKIGSVGMGLFSLVLSVYTFGVTFATSGVHLASTRLVSQELVKGSGVGVRIAMRKCLAYSLAFGALSFVVLFSFAEPISLKWLCDIRAVKSLKILAISLPFLSVSSALGGYFCAVRRVIKNAITNILEQFIRIFLTVTLFVLISGDDVESATVAVVIGMSVSEILAFIVSFILYVFDVRKNTKELKGEPSSNITMRLLKMSLPVAFSAYIRSALMTLENLLIPKGLIRGGVNSDAALSSYGIISGMVFPVIFFPLAFLSAFSSLVIPEITRYKEQGEKKHIDYVTRRIFKLTLIFSVAISGLFIYYSDLLGMFLYDSREAGFYIKIFAALIPVMYLDNSIDAVLKGMGEQVYSMRYNIIDALVSVILVYFLLPPLGIKGYVIVVYVCELINAALSMQRLFKILTLKVNIFFDVFAPVFSIVGATSLCSILFHFMNIKFSFTVSSFICGLCISIVLYYIFLRITYCVTSEDEKWFTEIFKSKKKV